MGALIEGIWRSETDYADARGSFERQDSRFRNWITADGSSGYPAVAGRYHLYVSPACPWCHRCMIFRVLKGLQGVVTMSAVEPLMLEDGWCFATPDPLTGARAVHEIYRRVAPTYTGRATVPILWDRVSRTIVSNESSEIIRMMNSAFAGLSEDRTDYYPADLAAEIDAVNERIYATVNNGVYRAGFATHEAPYRAAVGALFDTLDWLEQRLTGKRWLMGDRLTEADWRLFPTLVRFDAVYYGHFKCNLRHVYEYPALWDLTRALYQRPGIAATVSLDECKRHYYGSHRGINPTGIVPLGPRLDFTAPALR